MEKNLLEKINSIVKNEVENVKDQIEEKANTCWIYTDFCTKMKKMGCAREGDKFVYTIFYNDFDEINTLLEEKGYTTGDLDEDTYEISFYANLDGDVIESIHFCYC